ncbi:hypothetical protein GGE45_004914 [Rhizobium aethiopicum]|uniref:Uncharacterized protein n=1 Tax=Rhizobium aethiopicum TaxID=1138170 RepID=A0A7W6QCG6_9HYPH|nr:hypothetical protein [Rhizobium aethiopicum]MBB4582555.1 hypothetical protein [Rhizobium aethiopicum]
MLKVLFGFILLSSDLFQCVLPMGSDMIALVAFDLVLGRCLGGAAAMALVIEIPGVDRDDAAGDLAGLRIPGDVISRANLAMAHNSSDAAEYASNIQTACFVPVTADKLKPAAVEKRPTCLARAVNGPPPAKGDRPAGATEREDR